MHAVAYWGLLLALFVSIFSAGFASYRAFSSGRDGAVWMERTHWLVTLLFTVCSLILLWALVIRDFSNLYVSEYTDSVLPLFYAITAFWAGQDGSLLFWAWAVAILASLFPLTRGYQSLGERTKLLYWAFFFVTQSFFLLMLTNWSNPFREVMPPPPDGRGLNPLLQNPGMIFHPPLLFLGYAGFTIPACLALASRLAGSRDNWLAVARNWTLFSWAFLTAGIILGGWWSYMELGWGGYWAWDPVENASLIPWLAATAFLHTGVIESRRRSLKATNVFLAVLTLLLCFFGTYLVRSGVIDSLHAFGSGGVATPLLLFMIAGLGVALLTIFLSERPESRPMESLISRPGLLMVAAWSLLALGLVVFMGTMWPVLSKPFTENPMGLDAGFYNRVCLPLFTLIAVVLVFCPWFGWKGGVKGRTGLIVAAVTLAASAAVLAALGYTNPVALVAASSGFAVVAGWLSMFVTDPAVRRNRAFSGALAVHVGLGLVVLGVAISGPYQESKEIVIMPDQTFNIGEYWFRYTGYETGQDPAKAWVEAHIEVEKEGRKIGSLSPQRRIYRNFEKQQFAEVSVIPGLGNEFYATLLGTSEDGTASLKISINPLVNWIWIGGTIMCLAVFFCLRAYRGRSREPEE